MKKILVLIIVLFFSFEVYSNDIKEKISVEIGENIVEFSVPKDHKTLEIYYKELIKVYAQAENKNIELTQLLDKHIKMSEEYKKSFEELQIVTNSLKYDIKKYISLVNGFKWYVGGNAEYIACTSKTHIIELEPNISLLTKRYLFQLGIPISLLLINSSNLSVGAGLSLGFQYRFK